MLSNVEGVLKFAKEANIRPDLVDFLEHTAVRKVRSSYRKLVLKFHKEAGNISHQEHSAYLYLALCSRKPPGFHTRLQFARD